MCFERSKEVWGDWCKWTYGSSFITSWLLLALDEFSILKHFRQGWCIDLGLFRVFLDLLMYFPCLVFYRISSFRKQADMWFREFHKVAQYSKDKKQSKGAVVHTKTPPINSPERYTSTPDGQFIGEYVSMRSLPGPKKVRKRHKY